MSPHAHSTAPRVPFSLTEAEVTTFGEGGVVQREAFASLSEVSSWSNAIRDGDAAFTSAGTGESRHRSTAVRADRTAWDGDVPGGLPGLRQRFGEVQEALHTTAWMGRMAFDIQLAIHGPGSHYSPHRDALRGRPGRRVTAILYLNAAWRTADGGCLRIHAPSGETYDVEPHGGRLVLFLSEQVLHEVILTHATRHAATAWFRTRRT